MPAWAQRLAVFDLETTGLDLKQSRIVTACVAEIDSDGQVLSSAEWLADPGIEIPAIAASVHGITTEIARRDGRPAGQVVAEIIEALRALTAQGVAIVAYNASYDFSILYYEALRHQLTPVEQELLVIDPLVIDKTLDRYRKGKRNLETSASLFGIQLDNAHNATADAVAAGRIAQHLAKTYSKDLDISLAELHQKQIEWSKAIDVSYETWRRGNEPGYTAWIGWPIKK